MGINFHPEPAWNFGCVPLQLRLKTTRNQLEHTGGPAQLPRVNILPLSDLSVFLYVISLTSLNTKLGEGRMAGQQKLYYQLQLLNKTCIFLTSAWFNPRTNPCDLSCSFWHGYGSDLNNQKRSHKRTWQVWNMEGLENKSSEEQTRELEFSLEKWTPRRDHLTIPWKEGGVRWDVSLFS